MYTYIYYTIYIYYIYIHRYILAYIQPAPRYSICYTRTNRYDCVSLGSLVPPSLFFSYLYIYIYISYTCTLSISRSPLPLFFLQSSISFFSSVSLVRSRYRGDISVSGLNSSRSPLRSPERERESFRETVYRITEPLCEREREQGESGPVDATELMAASRRLHGQLNLTPIYAEATKINMAYFELPRETSHGFVRIPLETAANR